MATKYTELVLSNSLFQVHTFVNNLFIVHRLVHHFYDFIARMCHSTTKCEPPLNFEYF